MIITADVSILIDEALLGSLTDSKQVIIRFVKGNRLSVVESFATLDGGSKRIENLVLDSSVTDFWVAARSNQDQRLMALLRRLVLSRRFGILGTSRGIGAVYSLHFCICERCYEPGCAGRTAPYDPAKYGEPLSKGA
jgi:hypothetical protein